MSIIIGVLAVIGVCFCAFVLMGAVATSMRPEGMKPPAPQKETEDKQRGVTFDSPLIVPSLKPAHRVYSLSEQQELANLINTYVFERQAAGDSDLQLAEAVVVLAETYDDALKLRYGVK